MLSPPLRALASGALIGVLIVASVVAVAPWTAHAVYPVADYVHTLQTLFHYIARGVEIGQKYVQIYNQYRQLYYDAQDLAHDTQNLAKLDNYWARNVVGTMARMEATLDDYALPSHANPRVGYAHQQTYPGWEPPQNWWLEEELAATTTLDVLRRTLEAKYAAHRTAVDHIRTLLELKQQVKEVEGHEEALEVIAGITAFTAEVETLAQVAADTSADADTAYYSYIVNREARGARAFQVALDSSELELDLPPAGQGWAAVPRWWR